MQPAFGSVGFDAEFRLVLVCDVVVCAALVAVLSQRETQDAYIFLARVTARKWAKNTAKASEGTFVFVVAIEEFVCNHSRELNNQNVMSNALANVPTVKHRLERNIARSIPWLINFMCRSEYVSLTKICRWK